MAAKKLQKALAKSFNCLRLAVHTRKAHNFAQLWRQDVVKKTCLGVLRQRAMTRRFHNDCVRNMQMASSQKLSQKAILSLKYFILSQKGAKLLRAKIDQKTTTKAFDALRYQTISNRITNEFIQFKQSELKQKTLRFWMQRLL